MFENLTYIFDDNKIESIPDDSIDGVLFMTKTFFNKTSHANNDVNTQFIFYQAYLVLFNYLKAKGEETGKKLDSNLGESMISEVRGYFNGIHKKYSDLLLKREKEKLAEKLEAEISSKFKNEPFYELSESDLKKIQNLSSEIRKIINESTDFYDDHKLRILRLLGKFESELYRRMTHYGNFMALLWEVNTIYKNVKEAEPLLSVLFEIGSIIKNSISAFKGLPAGTDLPKLD